MLFNKGFVVNVAQVLQESQERMQVLKKAESHTLLQSVFLYLGDHPISDTWLVKGGEPAIYKKSNRLTLLRGPSKPWAN